MTSPADMDFNFSLSCGGPPALDCPWLGADPDRLRDYLEDFFGEEDQDDIQRRLEEWARTGPRVGEGTKIEYEDGTVIEVTRTA